MRDKCWRDVIVNLVLYGSGFQNTMAKDLTTSFGLRRDVMMSRRRKNDIFFVCMVSTSVT